MKVQIKIKHEQKTSNEEKGLLKLIPFGTFWINLTYKLNLITKHWCLIQSKFHINDLKSRILETNFPIIFLVLYLSCVTFKSINSQHSVPIHRKTFPRNKITLDTKMTHHGEEDARMDQWTTDPLS